MKIFTFVFPSNDLPDSKGENTPVVKHLVAKDFIDAIAVASEKGLTGYVQVSCGPDVVAIAGMFE